MFCLFADKDERNWVEDSTATAGHITLDTVNSFHRQPHLSLTALALTS